MDPLRGEVWDARLPGVGEHPCVVLSSNLLTAQLVSVTIAVVTGTKGPLTTHIPLGAEVGLTRYDQSYVNVTDLHTFGIPRCRRRRGLLHPQELRRVEEALRTYLSL